MIEYTGFMECFQEVPGEVTLGINIANCQNDCFGCHSSELRQRGIPLTLEMILSELTKGPYTCVCFFGEGRRQDKQELLDFIEILRATERDKIGSFYKIAVYCGRDIEPEEWFEEYTPFIDFLKVGSYKHRLGPLNKDATNQRMYEVWSTCKFGLIDWTLKEITDKFWRKKD